MIHKHPQQILNEERERRIEESFKAHDKHVAYVKDLEAKAKELAQIKKDRELRLPAGKERYPTDAEWDANEQGWKAAFKKAARMASARAGKVPCPVACGTEHVRDCAKDQLKKLAARYRKLANGD